MNYILKDGKKQGYRHGEILAVKIDGLPDGLVASTSKVLMVGSHGNNHSIDNGVFYPKQDGFVFGYLEAKNTNLLHPEHKDETGGAKIEDGFYELIKQSEFTPSGLIPIID